MTIYDGNLMARSISDSQCLIFKPRCLQSRHLIFKNNLITEKRPLLFLSAITMTLRFKRCTGIVTVLASPGLIHLPLFYHHFLICNGKITGFFDSGRCRDKFSRNTVLFKHLDMIVPHFSFFVLICHIAYFLAKT